MTDEIEKIFERTREHSADMGVTGQFDSGDIEFAIKEAFALGKAEKQKQLIEEHNFLEQKAKQEMLEEIKKELEFDNVGCHFCSGNKKRLENLNSPQKSEEADKCLLGDTSLEMDRAHSVDTNFDDFVKELIDEIEKAEEDFADLDWITKGQAIEIIKRKFGEKLCKEAGA